MVELTQETMATAQERVAAMLHAGGGPEGPEGAVAGAQSGPDALPASTTIPTIPPASPASPRPTRTRQARSAGKRTGTPNQSPSEPSQPTVNLTLPPEVYAYFQQQADADERTLAKYLQRLVREVWRERTQPATTATDAASATSAATDDPDFTTKGVGVGVGVE